MTYSYQIILRIHMDKSPDLRVLTQKAEVEFLTACLGDVKNIQCKVLYSD